MILCIFLESTFVKQPYGIRQIELEIINDIPDQALIIYANGSRSDTGTAGSGMLSNTSWSDVKISIMNADHCSVFRSKLIAISDALDQALNSNKDNIWILTDSSISNQYSKNWSKIMDSTSLNNIYSLAKLGQRKQLNTGGCRPMWCALGTRLLMIWLVGL
ncbi:RNase H domain-containing protein [Trichonephila clavipes]|nr:RNase H domain-containing protein [Trichonephila clavipes]